MKEQITLVSAYLSAIILANLLVARFGAIAVLPVGFVLIGLDLTGRDYLHELWRQHLLRNMVFLIGAGSLLSWLLNHNAGQVAIASFVAFMGAGIVDTITYHFLGNLSFLIRVNGSNVLSAFADSSIFLTVAFGTFIPMLILAQFGVKVGGGFLWSLVLRRFRMRYNAVLLRNTHGKSR